MTKKTTTKAKAKNTVTIKNLDGTVETKDAKEYLAEINKDNPDFEPEDSKPIESVMSLVNPVLAEQKADKKPIELKDPKAKISFKQSRAIVSMVYQLTGKRLDWQKIQHFTMAQASDEIKKLKGLLDGQKVVN